LGVVRHISEEDVDRFLGIELVSSGGVAVSLREANDQRTVTDDCLGVWLAGGAPKENQIRLLTPLGTYSPSAALHMRVHERKYLLTPVQRSLPESIIKSACIRRRCELRRLNPARNR
jgi:hypothetical protein